MSFLENYAADCSPLVVCSAVWCVVTGMGMELSFSGWCGSPRGYSSCIGLHAGQPPTLLEADIAGILH